MEDQVEQYPSSVFPGGDFERVETKQQEIPTIAIIVLLLVLFVLLKKFIYIPDDKRDGQ